MAARIAWVIAVLAARVAGAEDPPWAGVYAGPGPRATAALVPVGDQVWWLDRDATTVRLRARGAGFVVEPLGAALIPGRRGWRLRTAAGERVQVVDPFLVRLRAGLAGTRAFLHLGSDGRPDGARLTVTDGLDVALEVKPGRCVPALLRPDPSVNAERDVERAPAQPAPGGLGTRSFVLLERDPPCAPLPARAPAVHGLVAGAFVFGRADGTPVAVELVGYMMVEVYVAPELTPPELRQVLRAASEELGRQAE